MKKIFYFANCFTEKVEATVVFDHNENNKTLIANGETFEKVLRKENCNESAVELGQVAFFIEEEVPEVNINNL